MVTTCLTCGNEFESPGIWIRRCPSCKRYLKRYGVTKDDFRAMVEEDKRLNKLFPEAKEKIITHSDLL